MLAGQDFDLIYDCVGKEEDWTVGAAKVPLTLIASINRKTFSLEPRPAPFVRTHQYLIKTSTHALPHTPSHTFSILYLPATPHNHVN